jgi:hypothetical protein
MTLRPVDDDWSVPEAEDPDAWCAWCGTALPGFPSRRRRFCSLECAAKLRIADQTERRAAARAGMSCVECGTALDARRADRLYCTPACCDLASRRRRFGIRQCQHCGKDFLPSGAHVRYCSISCGRMWKPAKRASAFMCEALEVLPRA